MAKSLCSQYRDLGSILVGESRPQMPQLRILQAAAKTEDKLSAIAKTRHSQIKCKIRRNEIFLQLIIEKGEEIKLSGFSQVDLKENPEIFKQESWKLKPWVIENKEMEDASHWDQRLLWNCTSPTY